MVFAEILLSVQLIKQSGQLSVGLTCNLFRGWQQFLCYLLLMTSVSFMVKMLINMKMPEVFSFFTLLHFFSKLNPICQLFVEINILLPLSTFTNNFVNFVNELLQMLCKKSSDVCLQALHGLLHTHFSS